MVILNETNGPQNRWLVIENAKIFRRHVKDF